MPSCSQAVLLSNMLIDSRTGKQQLAPHAAGEREFLAVPVQVIFAYVETARGFGDGEKLIRLGWLVLSGRGQTHQSSAADLLKLTQKARQFFGGQFLREPQNELKFLTQFSSINGANPPNPPWPGATAPDPGIVAALRYATMGDFLSNFRFLERMLSKSERAKQSTA